MELSNVKVNQWMVICMYLLMSLLRLSTDPRFSIVIAILIVKNEVGGGKYYIVPHPMMIIILCYTGQSSSGVYC